MLSWLGPWLGKISVCFNCYIKAQAFEQHMEAIHFALQKSGNILSFFVNSKKGVNEYIYLSYFSPIFCLFKLLKLPFGCLGYMKKPFELIFEVGATHA